jgi:hypothetical protein
MPRIADQFADCSIYLYRSEQDAREGALSGGSGFLVHVPSKTDRKMGHLYAVANSHVLDEGFQTLRLTKRNGGIDTISSTRQSWIPHPKGDDVEVMPLNVQDWFRWWSVGTGDFLTHEIIDAYRIGFGDEVFLVGRLVLLGHKI